jgi:L-asparagine transporter-like permease
MNRQKQGLSAWQLTMLALGTVVGGSFFLGSAVAINAADHPSSSDSSWRRARLFHFVGPVGDDRCKFGFRLLPDVCRRGFREGAGFVVGWVYWAGMVLAMASEATAGSILARHWLPGVPIAVLGSVVILAVTLVNLLGADKICRLETSLAAVKLFAVVSFVVLAGLLITGLFPGRSAVGFGDLTGERFLPGGITGLAGSMLIVMFTYAGFEIIGLAASEAKNPKETIPKAIRYTVLGLVGLYVTYLFFLLPLIPTGEVSDQVSPIVAAMGRHGITWAGAAMNFVLITAILSTMLAAMFGLGRMMRSLAAEGLAPGWLKDGDGIPFRGIIASGSAMLLSLGFGLLFPRVYLFLISSGGFAILFSYIAIIATHVRFRRRYGCPPDGKCQMWGYPYTSYFVLASLLAAIAGMPFVSGQASGLLAGVVIVAFFSVGYLAVRRHRLRGRRSLRRVRRIQAKLRAELARELAGERKNKRE